MGEEIFVEEKIDVEVEPDTEAQKESAFTENEAAPEPSTTEADYAALVEEDLSALRSEFPELRAIRSILDLKNPIRYGALRDLGLTPTEAYLATEGRGVRRDNRSHLESSVPKGAARPTDEISRRELEMARELFSDLSDKEIHKLYKRVKG